MSVITLDEFENLPVLEKPPFLLAGSTKRYLDKDLSQQVEFVKERKARFYILHFYEATMGMDGVLSVNLTSDTVFDETKPAAPDIEFRQFLGQTKDERMEEIKAMQHKLKTANLWQRLVIAFKIVIGKE